MSYRRGMKDAERGRTSMWGARCMVRSIMMGAIAGVLLAIWTILVEDALMDFAFNGPAVVLLRPAMFLILLGGVVGWLLSLAIERMVGIGGAIRWLLLGSSLIALGTLFLGVTRVLGGMGFGSIRLLILCAFAAGTIAGAGLRQRLDG